MIGKFLILIFLSVTLSAKYTNCTFQNKHYSDICRDVVKSGVSVDYANKFLLSYFKTKKFDEISWKYLQPKHIKLHKKNEKKANNTLVGRIPQMMEHLYKYKKVYDYTEEKYGVDREVIAAILLKETNLGKIEPQHDAFIVFNTIVTRVDPKSPRQKWLLKMGKTNMASIIKHCYKGKIEPQECNLPSSYAGAVGIAQFMPSSFMYAKSFRQDEVGDLTKMEDAIVSASYYLHRRAKYNKLIDWSKMPDMASVENDWYEYEHKVKYSSFSYKKGRNGRIYNCYVCGKENLKYLDSYIKKVLKYNNSSNYAVGVIRLAHDAHFYK
ncbi:lytic murein transglycosylase [Sulfurimonas sp.]|uniref:lytic murein transglycosylase n=1 Tax=Sulfurimonas sp. TaxID=2022749 RepID=UPI00356A04B5